MLKTLGSEMKKLLIIMALIANVSAAPKNDWYVGLGFFGGDGEQEAIDAGQLTTTAFDTSGADIKFGIIFKSGNRFEFSALSMDLKASADKTTIKGRDFDWIFTPNLNNEKSIFLPFISTGFGSYTSDGIDSKGVSVQAAVGGYLRLYDVLEFELSYKKKVIIWSNPGNSTLEDISYEMTNVYVGAKYKF